MTTTKKGMKRALKTNHRKVQRALFYTALCVFCLYSISTVSQLVSTETPPIVVPEIQTTSEVSKSQGDHKRTTETAVQKVESTKTLAWKNSCRNSELVRLLLLHVNKAGGRSVEALFNVYQERHRYLNREPRSKYRKIEILDGHRHVSLLQKHAGCPPGGMRNCEDTTVDRCTRWIMMLREPVSRTLSAFYTSTGRQIQQKTQESELLKSHFRCPVGSKGAKILENPASSFEEWAQLPFDEQKKCWKYVSNLHCKYLAPEFEDDSEAQYNAAAHRLQKELSFLGLMERFQESMQLLSFTFDLDMHLYTPVFNRNKYNKDISDTARKVLETMNKYDIKLYKLAKDLFESRLSGMKKFYPMSPDLVPFVCDSKVVCWDKTGTFHGKWDMNQRPSGMTDGVYKETVLCANENGCFKSPPPPPAYRLPGYLQAIPPGQVSTARCIPSFFIIGTRKGGTTSLYRYIVQHPGVRGVKVDQGPKSGEMLFFRDLFLKKRKATRYRPEVVRKQYNAAFRTELQRLYPGEEVEGKYITGESSVDLSASCGTPLLFSRACGRSNKLIYLVRNPVDRIVSNVRMRQRLGKGEGLNTTVRKWLADIKRQANSLRVDLGSNEWWSDVCLYQNDYVNGIWAGMYIVHIQRWLAFVDEDNLLVLKTESMLKDPLLVVTRAMQHVGLDPSAMNDLASVVDVKYNSAPSAADDELSPELREELVELYRPFNQALSQQFDIDITDWK